MKHVIRSGIFFIIQMLLGLFWSSSLMQNIVASIIATVIFTLLMHYFVDKKMLQQR